MPFGTPTAGGGPPTSLSEVRPPASVPCGPCLRVRDVVQRLHLRPKQEHARVLVVPPPEIPTAVEWDDKSSVSELFRERTGTGYFHFAQSASEENLRAFLW